MIKTTALSKKFDDNEAVEKLTLDIADGELFGFLGPNGAGKTTTVRMLCALISPTSGEAIVGGFRVGEENQAIRKNVGILTETPGLYDRLSAYRNLLIFAELYEVEKPKRQVEKYLRLLDLWERRKDSAGTFSKGMRQKLAIARTLLHEPKVLFLDEPTSGLDPAAAQLVRSFIEDLREKGRTIFVCTHNLDEAERLCDRVAIFNHSLRVVDTPNELRRKLYGLQVHIELVHDAAEWVSAVEGLACVEKVSAETHHLYITVQNPRHDSPKLIQALIQQGASVRFAQEHKAPLEDVYLRLVNMPVESTR